MKENDAKEIQFHSSNRNVIRVPAGGRGLGLSLLAQTLKLQSVIM